MDNSNGGNFTVGSDWTYSGKLPDGSYTASIEVLVIGGVAGFEYVNVYSIGSVVVNGSAVTANFAVPDLGQLSGALSITGSSLPESTVVTATDKTVPLPSGYTCCAPPSTTLSLVDAGADQMRLAAGRSYDVTVMVPDLVLSVNGQPAWSDGAARMDGVVARGADIILNLESGSFDVTGQYPCAP